MRFRNTPETYGITARTFHWVLAALIIFMLGLGLWMADLPSGPDKLRAIGLHKSLGALILLLVLARLAWRLYNTPPALIAMPRLLALAATAGHRALYVCMLAMPLTGWAMSSAAGFPVSVFGLFTLPDIAPHDKALSGLLLTAHEWIAYALIALIVGHAGAALWHHFVRKDNTLRRMLLSALLCLAAAHGVLAADQKAVQKKEIVPAPAYVLVPEKSTLTFTATQNDAPVRGEFKHFTADIRFDPNNLQGSSVVVEVDMASLSAPPNIIEQLAGADWFDSAKFPKAVFSIKSLRPMPGLTGNQGYYGDGTLTLRGKTAPVSLNFTLEEFDGTHAVAVGTVPLLRTQFGVGQGQWKDTDMVKDNVTVQFRVTAVRK